MKKTYIVCILLAVLVLAAGTGAFLLIGDSVDAAEAAYAANYEQYVQMRSNALNTGLTVTEDGMVVGTYSLEQLGVLEDTQAAVDGCFAEMDRMEPEVFANLSVKTKLEWNKLDHTGTRAVAVELSQLDLTPVLQDLASMPRSEAENAYVEFQDGQFIVHEEIAGTALDEGNVRNALTQAVGMLVVDDGIGSAEIAAVELTEHGCYLEPELTVENANFDFDAMLRDSVKDLNVKVDFHGTKETLDGENLNGLLHANAQGKVMVDEAALAQIVANWAETHKQNGVSYLLDSYVDGVRPVEFLTVDYDVDQEGLVKLLREELVHLKDVELETPWLCWRNGEAFSLGDTYVEVDIKNQVMTYFRDGEVFVTTDVVTGAVWGYPTPEGLYQVENKDTECWLSGADYNVYVDYWVGFIGFTYGLHDADWRTNFGGDVYIRNGSHGCVNTPKEAMAEIFENIEIGVPVLVYDKPSML